MYKLPENVKNSTVYRGFKIAVGWPTVRKFFTIMRRDGYFIYRMVHSYSSNDGYELRAEFIKDGKVFRMDSFWIQDGSKSLLKAKYKIKKLEITDAPLQN